MFIQFVSIGMSVTSSFSYESCLPLRRSRRDNLTKPKFEAPQTDIVFYD